MSINNPSFKEPPIIIRGATSDVSSLKSDLTNPPKLTPVSGQLLLEDSSLIKPLATKMQNCDTWEVGLTLEPNSTSEEILKFCGTGEEESSFDVKEIQDKTKQIIYGYNTGKLPYVKPKGRSGSNQFDSSSFSDSQYGKGLGNNDFIESVNVFLGFWTWNMFTGKYFLYINF